MGLFHSKHGLSQKFYEYVIAKMSYEAGYNQRSQEVAEDMKLLENILSHVDTEH